MSTEATTSSSGEQQNKTIPINRFRLYHKADAFNDYQKDHPESEALFMIQLPIEYDTTKATEEAQLTAAKVLTRLFLRGDGPLPKGKKLDATVDFFKWTFDDTQHPIHFWVISDLKIVPKTKEELDQESKTQ